MASELNTVGTPTQVTASVNGMQPSLHPGQSNQLSRVQTAAIAEIQAFPTATSLKVEVSCHRDNAMSHISIRVFPVKVDKYGNLQTPPGIN